MSKRKQFRGDGALPPGQPFDPTPSKHRRKKRTERDISPKTYNTPEELFREEGVRDTPGNPVGEILDGDLFPGFRSSGEEEALRDDAYESEGDDE